MTKDELQKVIDYLGNVYQKALGRKDTMPHFSMEFCDGIYYAISKLEELPVDEKKDIVSVVRCKDCCYFDELKDITGYYCGYCHFGFDDTSCIPVGRNGYCSSGKRKENE